MDEHQQTAAAKIAEIKARVEGVKTSIRNGEPTVHIGSVYYPLAQLGLRTVVADQWGRLWRDDGDTLTLLHGGAR